MPWKEVQPKEEKLKFVTLARTGRCSVAELCREFGISRKTGHKYLARYGQSGIDGLEARSRRPKHSPAITDTKVEKLILRERRRRPSWGPKKLRLVLERDYGIVRPPASSTIGRILARHGLSQARKRRPGVYRVHPDHLTEPTRPHQVWTVDFKGWFCCRDGQQAETGSNFALCH